MKEYLWQLLVLALVCGVIEQFAPSGEGGGLARNVRFIGGICLLATLVQPIAALVENGVQLPSLARDFLTELQEEADNVPEDMEERWQEELSRLDGAMAAGQVKQMLLTEFTLAEDDVTVGLQLNTKATAPQRIHIGLSGRAIWQDTHAIEDWVRETFDCEVSVYIEDE